MLQTCSRGSGNFALGYCRDDVLFSEFFGGEESSRITAVAPGGSIISSEEDFTTNSMLWNLAREGDGWERRDKQKGIEWDGKSRNHLVSAYGRAGNKTYYLLLL